MTSPRRAIGGFLLASALLLAGALATGSIAGDRLAEVSGVAASAEARRSLDLILRFGTGLAMALAMFANLVVVRRSIVAVVVPRQLGNLVIGEAVPGGVVTVIALVAALLAGSLVAALPTDLLAVQFAQQPLITGELDPFLGRDLGFYWAWVPFERWLLDRAVIVWGGVSLVSALTYVSTASIRIGPNGVWIAPFARRHVGVLIGLSVLLLGWEWRLQRFDLIGAAVQPFGLTAHRVLAPAYRLLAWTAWPLAAAFVIAAWRGSVALAAIVTVLVGGAGPLVNHGLPILVERRLTAVERERRDASYGEVARQYAARQADDSIRLMIASQSVGMPELSFPESLLIAPAAGRYAVVRDAADAVVGPPMDRLVDQLVFAWALRAPGLLRAPMDAGSRVVAPRDPIARVQRLAPFVTVLGAPRWLEGGPPGARWAVDLAVTADRYPMVEAVRWEGGEARYLRRAGIAYVDATTGAVAFAWITAPDPILRRWQALMPVLVTGPMALTATEAVLWAGGTTLNATDAAAADSSAGEAAIRSVFDALVAARRRGDWRGALDAEARLGRLLGPVPD
jgi:uncharacterized membrane protein (UPF0182 family)